MSATIYWAPKKKGTALKNTLAPSSFQEYLESALDRCFPLTLSVRDIQALGIARRLAKDSNFQKDIQELTMAVITHNEIEVWAR